MANSLKDRTDRLFKNVLFCCLDKQYKRGLQQGTGHIKNSTEDAITNYRFDDFRPVVPTALASVISAPDKTIQKLAELNNVESVLELIEMPNKNFHGTNLSFSVKFVDRVTVPLYLPQQQQNRFFGGRSA